MQFETTPFAQMISTDAGRAVRVVAGVAMIGAGLRRGDAGGAVLAVLGLVPLAAGALDLCVLSPIFGGPLAGAEIRAAGERVQLPGAA